MNGDDGLGLSKHQHVDEILEIAVVRGQRPAAELVLAKAERVHHGANRAVKNQDPLLRKATQPSFDVLLSG